MFIGAESSVMQPVAPQRAALHAAASVAKQRFWNT
jgi:hypothetical protein